LGYAISLVLQVEIDKFSIDHACELLSQSGFAHLAWAEYSDGGRTLESGGYLS
jgi:hypothetical protein